MSRLPSPSMAVALLALFVALGGTSIAATALISGTKIRKNSMPGDRVKKGTLSGDRLRARTITGRQIDLAKLGVVPSAVKALSADSATKAATADSATNAASADSAAKAVTADSAARAATADDAKKVGGLSIVAINHRGGNTAATEIASLNGLSIRVACTSGEETITLTTTTPGAGEASSISDDASNAGGSQQRGAYDDEFVPGEILDVTAGGSSSERQYAIHYSGADGRNVTSHLTTEDDLGADICIVSGYAIG